MSDLVNLLARAALLAYPRQFRREYGTEWNRTIRDLRAHSRRSTMRVASTVIAEALTTAVRMRWETLMAPAKTLLTVIAAAALLVALLMGSAALTLGLIALATLIGLQYAGTERPIATKQPSATRPWYLWLAVAMALFAIGLGAAMVLGDGKTATGEDDTSLLNALAWITMMSSWAFAAITLVFGATLGAKKVIHHRRATARTPHR